MTLGGITLFINSDDVKKIAQDGELHEFPGVINLCLSNRYGKSASIAIVAYRNIEKQLKEGGLVPKDCEVKIIAIGVDDEGSAGLVVNYVA